MKKLLMIGNIPPPSGGVSVFVGNLTGRLRDDGYPVDLIQPKDGKWAILLRASSWRKFWNADVCLVNIKGPSRLAVIVLLFLFNVRTIVVQHNLRDSNKWYSVLSYCMAKAVVFVNGEAEREFRESKLARLAQTFLVPAFVKNAPATNQSDKQIATNEFVETVASTGKKLFVTYANFNKGRVKLHEGRDLYGIDLVLDAFEEHLSRSGNAQDTRLLILDPLGGGHDHYQSKVQQICSKYGDCVMYQTADLDMRTVLKYADAYLRWTLTDGDSVAVREALDEGCPVIASSVCRRPDGCKLVDLGNFEELVSTFNMKLVRDTHGQDYYDQWRDIIFGQTS